MEEQYDFYAIGQKHAKDELLNLRKIAYEYEKKYGLRAKKEYELGIASIIPAYSKIEEVVAEEDLSNVGGTNDYAVPNSRNNSYFGYTGIGRQTERKIVDGEVVNEYIEPKGPTR